jgi:hypothetical protein
MPDAEQQDEAAQLVDPPHRRRITQREGISKCGRKLFEHVTHRHARESGHPEGRTLASDVGLLGPRLRGDDVLIAEIM